MAGIIDGPAGCAAAYYSASRGMKTLILEKESLPRYKPCGGGVNLRAAQLLPFDFSPVVERCVHGGELSCRLRLVIFLLRYGILIVSLIFAPWYPLPRRATRGPFGQVQ